MQKKIIALAIAAAVSAPAYADNSNVTIYGVANVSYDMVNVGANATTHALASAAANGYSANKVSSNTSRLGLKGSEDLGGGLAAAWQIESLVNIDNSNASGNTIGSRNTYLGLAGGFGTVLMGRHDTPYNIASRSMDLFTDGIADNRSLMGGAGISVATANALVVAPGLGAVPVSTYAGFSAGAAFDGRQPDVVAYISPAMSGFTGAIAYVAGAEGRTLSTQSKGSAWSLAGLYGNGPLNVNVGYEVHNIGGATGTVGITGIGAASYKETAWKLAASYTMDAFTINGVYEKTSDDFGALVNALSGTALAAGSDVLGHRSYYLAGKYAFGNDAVKLAYTNHGDRNMGGVTALSTNTGATQISLGYDHALSKRTTVYGLYTKISNDAGSAFALSGNGTGGGATTQNGAGASPSAFSLGMKHTF